VARRPACFHCETRLTNEFRWTSSGWAAMTSSMGSMMTGLIATMNRSRPHRTTRRIRLSSIRQTSWNQPSSEAPPARRDLRALQAHNRGRM
jgi:hypothetical protein